MFLVELTNTRVVIATLKDARDWNYNKVNWTTAEPRFLVTGFLYLKPFYIPLVYDFKGHVLFHNLRWIFVLLHVYRRNV